MTYEQYWYGDPWMVRAYAQAFLIRRRLDNENAWLLGAYVANAVSTSLNNAFRKHTRDYLKKPFDIFEKTEAEKAEEIRRERQKLIDYFSRMTIRKENPKMGVDQNGSKS